MSPSPPAPRHPPVSSVHFYLFQRAPISPLGQKAGTAWTGERFPFEPCAAMGRAHCAKELLEPPGRDRSSEVFCPITCRYYFGRYSTPSNISTICNPAHNSAVSPPAAACFSPVSTCCHVDFARASFGRCPSSVRTSASVTRSMTVGIVRAGAGGATSSGGAKCCSYFAPAISDSQIVLRFPVRPQAQSGTGRFQA